MKHTSKFALLLLLLISTNIYASKYSIEVEIDNIHSTEGEIIIAVYKLEQNFPYNPFKTYTVEKKDIIDNE